MTPGIRDIDEYLRLLARSSSHTQVAMAAACGVRENIFSNWLNGRTKAIGVVAAERLYYSLTGHLFIPADWRKLPYEGSRYDKDRP